MAREIPDLTLRVAVLIPALNEEEAIPGVLDRLPRHELDQIVVVDNGSTDRTAEKARSRGATVVREERRGYGAACLAGLAHLAALPDPPDAIVFMDADQWSDPDALARVLAPVLANEADLVLGVRITPDGASQEVPLHARLGNRLVLGLTRVLFGYHFSDLPPFRAASFARLQELEMDDRDWGWTLQMQLRARAQGHRVVEVPIPHRGRREGESKISGTVMGSVRAGAKMFYTLFRERFRKRFRTRP